MKKQYRILTQNKPSHANDGAINFYNREGPTFNTKEEAEDYLDRFFHFHTINTIESMIIEIYSLKED